MLAAARLPPLVCLSAHDPPAAAPPQRRLRAAGCTRYTHSAKATADVARARRRTCCCALPLDSLLNSLTPLQQDLAAAAVAAIGARVCVKTCDRLAQDGVLDRKLTRKLVHIICGPGFLLTWLLFSNSTEARYIAALVPLANGVRLFCIGTGLVSNEAAVKAISREGDKSELLRGPLYYVVVMVFATIAFWRASPVGIVAISLMCGGDGLADVVGRRLGRVHKLPFNPAKSWAGSCAMFLASLLFSAATLAVFQNAGAFAVDWTHTLPALLLISAVATAVEAAPWSDALDDNISVPAVAMLLAAVLL